MGNEDGRSQGIWLGIRAIVSSGFAARLILTPLLIVREIMMPSFDFDIGEKERVGSRFLSDVRDELQRALSIEKSLRKITQQDIATLLGTSRAVINRQIIGAENIGIKRVAEILWAIGWEPCFEARRVPDDGNHFPFPMQHGKEAIAPALTTGPAPLSAEPDPVTKKLIDGLVSNQNPAPALVG